MACLAAVFGAYLGGGANLLPNGDVEDAYGYRIDAEARPATSIEADAPDWPLHWRLSGGARRGLRGDGDGYAIALPTGGDQSAQAVTYADFWRVKDPAMPFGLPIAPDRPVALAFTYRTEGGAMLRAELRLGTVAGLSTTTEALSPAGSSTWQRAELTITPEAWHWGAEVAFTATGDGGTVWIDDVHLAQALPDGPNRAVNPSFEFAGPSGWPSGWDGPVADQWVSWVGSQLRPAARDASDSMGGAHALRLTATYGDLCGISQEILLNQARPRPIGISLWCKLDNAIGHTPHGYFGCDNLPNATVYVHFTDGTMQEASPTFSLGESDHGWEYRRFGFLPEKPVDRIRLQLSLIGTEPTTSLWIDDVAVWELDPPRGVDAPAQTISAAWGQAMVVPGHVAAVNDGNALTVAVPWSSGRDGVRIAINPHAFGDALEFRRYVYDAYYIYRDGRLEVARAVEKQGYIREGPRTPLSADGVTAAVADGAAVLRLPWGRLGLAGPLEHPIGLQASGHTDPPRWAVLLAAPARPVRIAAVRFGNRYALEPDQSQDFVTHPPVYAGENVAAVTLVVPDASAPKTYTLEAGVEGEALATAPVTLDPGKRETVHLTYTTGPAPAMASFVVRVRDGAGLGVEQRYPLAVPDPVEAVLDQAHYRREESIARIEVHTRLRPMPAGARVHVVVRDRTRSRTVLSLEEPVTSPVAKVAVPIGMLRIHDEPLQDYQIEVALVTPDGAAYPAAPQPFGRLERVQRRPLPPIEHVEVGRGGRLLINGDTPFFPIIASLASEEERAGVDLGANVLRAYYVPGPGTAGKPSTLEATAAMWAEGAYTVTIGPFPNQMEAFRTEADALLGHPGFLGCYGKQFYHWRLNAADWAYREAVEALVGDPGRPRLTIWGHHDSSLLYDLRQPATYAPASTVGYCYTKIMGRPGPHYRNAPMLTQVEATLAPDRFKLGEVNYYVSWHDDEIVPEHFKTYYSLRADDWQGVRCESYLAVIHGANGLYHYVCAQPGGLQRLRGWFHEAHLMAPIFAAEDAPHRVLIEPADSPVAARLKVWGGRLFLITANSGETAADATIRLEGAAISGATKRFALPGALAVEEGALHDTWPRYGAHVYEISAVK